MLGWGDAILATYSKQREAYKRDFTLRYLGYSTDNGAYYYVSDDDCFWLWADCRSTTLQSARTTSRLSLT